MRHKILTLGLLGALFLVRSHSAAADATPLLGKLESVIGRFVLTETPEGAALFERVMSRSLVRSEYGYEMRLFVDRLANQRALDGLKDALDARLSRVEERFESQWHAAGRETYAQTVLRDVASEELTLQPNAWFSSKRFEFASPGTRSYERARAAFVKAGVEEPATVLREMNSAIETLERELESVRTARGADALAETLAPAVDRFEAAVRVFSRGQRVAGWENRLGDNQIALAGAKRAGRELSSARKELFEKLHQHRAGRGADYATDLPELKVKHYVRFNDAAYQLDLALGELAAR